MIVQLMLFILQDALFMLGYLSRGSVFPQPLGCEEETGLIERMADGDREAREKLIEHNLRLCVLSACAALQGLRRMHDDGDFCRALIAQ